MGGFGNVLGQAAAGYVQAAELDKRRQFETEMDRRQQLGGFLAKLAGDETARPESRQAAIQEFINLQHAPFNKPYKFNPDVLLAPPRTDTFTPPSGGGIAPPTPANALAQGAPVEPPKSQQHPPMLLSPPTPPEMPAMAAGPTPPAITAGAGSTPVSHTTPGSVFMTPSEIGQHRAAELEPGVEAQVQGQIQARLSMLQKAMHDDPSLANDPARMMLILSGNVGYGFLRPQAGGTDTAANMRAAGLPVPQSIPDNQYVRAETNMLGQTTFVPTAPPSGLVTKTISGVTNDPVTGLPTTRTETVTPQLNAPTPPNGSAPAAKPAPKASAATPGTGTSVSGRRVPAQYASQVAAMAADAERNGKAPEGKYSADVQSYMQENGMTLHTAQQVSDYQKMFDVARSEDRRFKLMYDVLKRVKDNPTPDNVGSMDAALLAYHMGMTVGQVKGMRSGRDMVMLHEHARSLPESLRVAAESWVNGSQLSPEQRQNFVDLAEESRKTAWEQAVANARGMQFSYFPQPTPGLPPLSLWPGTLNRTALNAVAKDHSISYGEARRQAIAAGYNIDDYQR